MKKVILLSTLLIGGTAFAQNAPIDFEPGGFGADFTWATFEIPDGESIDFTVESNPATSGINSSATAAKMDISYATEASWGQAGCETMHGADLGSFVFNESNSTVKVMVYQEGFAAPVAVKFATPIGAALPEVVMPNDVADEWVEITFDLSAWIDFAENTPDQFIFFPSYGPRATGHVVWFDNVEFSEGGSTGGGDPMVSAPDPTIDESEVLSVYSNFYQTNTVENFNFIDFQGGGLITEVDIESDGNLTGKIEGLTFYGAKWDAVDVNDYLFVHLDYWSTSSTSFNFYLIDQTAAIPGGAIEEARYSFGAGGDQEIVQGEWVSVFIPLQHFLDYDAGSFDYDLDDIGQYKFDGNGTLWFDNIYFTSNPLSVSNAVTEGLKAFPNPSVDSWTVSSETSSIKEVRVFNALGQVVLSTSPNANMTQIDASGLDKGFYIAEIRTDLGTGTIKLIKE